MNKLLAISIIATLAFPSSAFASDLLIITEDQPNTIQTLDVQPGQDAEVVLSQLQVNDAIRHVERIVSRTVQLEPNDPYFTNNGSTQTYLRNTSSNIDINIESAWDITTGSRDIVVAVIDTGIDIDHPDLGDNIWSNAGEIAGNGIDDDSNGFVDDVYGWDFVDNDNDVNPDFVEDGPLVGVAHGTHIAGIIGALTNNGIGVAGINWNVSVMSLRAFNETGNASTDDISEALQYAIDQGVDVINMSYGGDEQTFLENQLLQQAATEGIILLAATGNSNEDVNVTPTYPACYSNVMGVTATTNTDARASFSNYGSDCADIAAPGVNVYNTYPLDSETGWDAPYGYMSGTSMATPVVSGVAALLLSHNFTNQSAGQLVLIMQNTSDPLSDASLGSGRINAGNALASLAAQFAIDQPTITAYPNQNMNRALSRSERIKSRKPYFTWTAPESTLDVAGYYVLFGNTKDNPSEHGTFQTARSFITKGIRGNNKKYFMRVKAVDVANGESEIASFRLFIDNIVVAPIWKTIEETSSGLRLSWNPVKRERVVGYHVYRARGKQKQFRKINHSIITDATFLDTTLTRGKKYKYKIQAVDDLGNQSDLSRVYKKRFN